MLLEMTDLVAFLKPVVIVIAAAFCAWAFVTVLDR